MPKAKALRKKRPASGRLYYMERPPRAKVDLLGAVIGICLTDEDTGKVRAIKAPGPILETTSKEKNLAFPKHSVYAEFMGSGEIHVFLEINFQSKGLWKNVHTSTAVEPLDFTLTPTATRAWSLAGIPFPGVGLYQIRFRVFSPKAELSSTEFAGRLFWIRRATMAP